MFSRYRRRGAVGDPNGAEVVLAFRRHASLDLETRCAPSGMHNVAVARCGDTELSIWVCINSIREGISARPSAQAKRTLRPLPASGWDTRTIRCEFMVAQWQLRLHLGEIVQKSLVRPIRRKLRQTDTPYKFLQRSPIQYDTVGVAFQAEIMNCANEATAPFSMPRLYSMRARLQANKRQNGRAQVMHPVQAVRGAPMHQRSF